jgi:hypothetical protein
MLRAVVLIEVMATDTPLTLELAAQTEALGAVEQAARRIPQCRSTNSADGSKSSARSCGRYVDFEMTRMKSTGDCTASSNCPRFIRLRKSAIERAWQLIDRYGLNSISLNPP